MQEELKILFSRLLLFVIFLLVIPGLSYGIWWIKQNKEFGIILLDKTVPNTLYSEHRGLFWIFEHEKFVKPKTQEFYDLELDYFGFFPTTDVDNEVSIKDFSIMDSFEKSSLVSSNEVLIIADTYGVYRHDDSANGNSQLANQKLYGGLDASDLEIISLAQEMGKTIISEYNSIASPTPVPIRSQFENQMGVKWTGWVARYFDELDTLANSGLPSWLVTTYKSQHQEDWSFKGPGLVFVHESGRIEIFDSRSDYQNQVPLIRTPRQNKAGFILPEVVPYPDWFDIVLIQRDYEVISYYDIKPTDEGLERLRGMGLPRFFPAVVFRPNQTGRIYYLSGDFSDLKLNFGSPRFWGLATLWRGFYSVTDYRDRQSFFWNYYEPLMNQILNQAYMAQKEKN
ncbi:MAG: hypothetical protein HWE09_00320 [Cyclobacteriaceae bacterium]|nr:hypothetical protein [Cyclobacteriaceae bacterium]